MNLNIRINQKNSGVCVSRNAGLLIARGEYIWFIDSDDIIKRELLKRLKTIADSGEYECIIVLRMQITVLK